MIATKPIYRQTNFIYFGRDVMSLAFKSSGDVIKEKHTHKSKVLNIRQSTDVILWLDEW